MRKKQRAFKRKKEQREHKRHLKIQDVRMNYGLSILSLAYPDVLDKLIIWRSSSPAYRQRMNIREKGNRRAIMQRQFTIELRVDYADNDKNEAMRVACAQAARHVYATAVLLADAVKPQIAIFSDDFFQGHSDIALLDDTIAQGTASISEPGEAKEQISSELMQAARDQ